MSSGSAFGPVIPAMLWACSLFGEVDIDREGRCVVIDWTRPPRCGDARPSRREEDMSTNQQYRNLTADPTPPKEAKEPETKASKLDLSVTKIVGGALAAMTAAALGSRLSVAGTIVGAALASVIAAVASALYTASLKHTQEKVRTVWTGRTGDADVPTTIEVTDTHHAATSSWAPAQPSVPQWDPPGPAPLRKPRKPLSWKSIVVAAMATFGIAAVSLTAYELISGQALSGGEGTTITQASEPRKAPEQKKPAGTETKSPSPTAEPSSSDSAEPEPSATASEQPAPEPSATTSQPTPSPPATPSASPTPTETPSAPTNR
jgi:hypothetical protein